MTQEEIREEALSRARTGLTLSNYPAIFAGFMAKGIAQHDIEPRVNVFTYNAWRALGRQVRRGEHGVKVTTFVPVEERKDPETGEPLGEANQRRPGRRPWTATVFHVSQTDPMKERAKEH